MAINLEKKMLRFLRNGKLSIDRHGNIWRNFPDRSRRINYRSKRGYIYVTVKLNGMSYSCSAHRLIWQFFNGDIPSGFNINHLNGIKHDNRLCNLEIVTPRENLLHAMRTGLIKLFGEDNGNSRLANYEVEEIKILVASGFKQKEISEFYDIDQSHVSRIINGKRRQVA